MDGPAAARRMDDNNERYRRALRRFDDANAADPNRTVVDGQFVPDELLYAQRMTAWLERLDPAASEPLRLAVRCQHLCRWMIPRSQYPMSRAGYHQWRTTLARFHADEAAKILRDVGYDEPTIARVQSLVRKEGLKTDPDAQTLEDVACLVFLEHEFSAFARQHDEAKVVNILARTWRKMSDRGHAAALGLQFSAENRVLVEKAVAAAGTAGPTA